MASLMVLTLCFFTTMFPDTNCYFIDEKSTVQRIPGNMAGGYFGFSLSLYKGDGNLRLLVGAPRANTTLFPSTEPGDIYSCSLESEKICTQLYVDRRDQNSMYSTFIKEQVMDRQGLGVTLSVRNEHVVTCSPWWRHIDSIINSDKRTVISGRCFKNTDTTLKTFKDFSPIEDKMKGDELDVNAKGFCMGGFSSVLTKDNNMVFGAPGCRTYRGSLIETDMTYQQTVYYDSSLTKDQVFNKTNNDNVVLKNLFYKYRGYKTVSGRFKEKTCIATSLPMVSTVYKNNNISQIFEDGPTIPLITILEKIQSNYEVWTTLYPPSDANTVQENEYWLFSYYGASLEVMDVNNDALDDLIVGAPTYSRQFIDGGAVLIYTQSYENNVYSMQAPRVIYGESKGGRFGTSVACIGDIDGDGYNDLAVGGPFRSEGDGFGAVYIYRGGENGIEPTYVQRIIGFSPSFGYAIGTNFQLELGNRNDIAIGAPSVDEVILLRSFQALSVDYGIKLNSEFFIQNECKINGEILQCSDLEVCIQYVLQGEKSAKFDESEVKFELKLDIDNTEMHNGLKFDDNQHTRTFILKPNSPVEKKCESTRIHTTKKELQSRTFNTLIEIVKPEKQSYVLAFDTMLYKRKELQIRPQCTSDVCSSDILLSFISVNNYKLLDDSFTVAVEIENVGGDDFYQSKLTLDTKEDLSVGKILHNSSFVNSDEVTIAGPYEVTLSMILEVNRKITFEMRLEPTQKFKNSMKTHSQKFEIQAKVNPQDKIQNPSAATKNINVDIDVSPEYEFHKIDNENTYDVKYSKNVEPSKAKSLEEVGPAVKHVYRITNLNKYALYRTLLTIYIPSKLKGEYFMYVEKPPTISGTWSKCIHSGVKVDEFGLSRSTSAYNDTYKEETVILPDNLYDENVDEYLKNNANWMKYECTIGELASDKSATFTISSRFSSAHLESEGDPVVHKLMSIAVSQLDELPLGAKVDLAKNTFVNTNINYVVVPGQFPIWGTALLAILGSIVAVGLVIIVLYKVGFFKRKNNMEDKKSEDDEEQQEPLKGRAEDIELSNTPQVVNEKTAKL